MDIVHCLKYASQTHDVSEADYTLFFRYSLKCHFGLHASWIVITYECEEKWHKNLKSRVQSTPETSCILSTVSTMVNVERQMCNMRKCNRTTGSFNRPAFCASSTTMQARKQFRNSWWSGESTHFLGLVVRIYVNTMPRELQSHWSFYAMAEVVSYVPVWVVTGDGRFHYWPGYLQRTNMLASNSYLQSSTSLLWRQATPELKQRRLIQLPVTLRCHRAYSFIRTSFLNL